MKTRIKTTFNGKYKPQAKKYCFWFDYFINESRVIYEDYPSAVQFLSLAGHREHEERQLSILKYLMILESQDEEIATMSISSDGSLISMTIAGKTHHRILPTFGMGYDKRSKLWAKITIETIRSMHGR